jgi:hypothetical protein
MSLFEGSAPNPVTLTSTATQSTPGFLTDYQKALAATGTNLLGTVTTDPTTGAVSVQPKTGDELIADRASYLSNLQEGIDPTTGKPYTNLPGLGNLQDYQGALSQALTAGTDASGVSASDISKFYDPYQKQVIDEMQRQSDINLQRSILPGLKALGIGSGQFGSSRIGSIGGQTLADIASQLQSQQTAARSAGYKQALDAALKEQGQQAAATGALAQAGSASSQAAERGIKTLQDVGAADLAYDQSVLEAPLTRALNVSKLLQGYQFPTSTTASKQELPSVMSPSALQQIAGLGSLTASLFPPGGKGAGSQAIQSVKDYIADRQAKGLALNMADIDRIVADASSGGTMDSTELDNFLKSIINFDPAAAGEIIT